MSRRRDPCGEGTPPISTWRLWVSREAESWHCCSVRPSPAFARLLPMSPAASRPAYPPSGHGAWTLNGKEIPYADTLSCDPWPRPSSTVIKPSKFDCYLVPLEDADHAARTSIPVERINGPVLMISGVDDQLWPSAIAQAGASQGDAQTVAESCSRDHHGRLPSWRSTQVRPRGCSNRRLHGSTVNCASPSTTCRRGNVSPRPSDGRPIASVRRALAPSRLPWRHASRRARIHPRLGAVRGSDSRLFLTSAAKTECRQDQSFECAVEITSWRTLVRLNSGGTHVASAP
ncbi:hypothetical protein VPARA_13630 [Variovorax paradoxus]|uniref:BAAT/Acyl-CoA thioester hydrolase C-terminal domain-containing protein n=1 Tax=Variovorax paradoxus TaxID=34073 RepID=A0A0H2M4J3_VARPD|nr:hypothetical protein VPARA_13630 [Variovorax paradoxus]